MAGSGESTLSMGSMIRLDVSTKRQKEHFEKYLIWEFFDFSRQGFFVDVGAFHSEDGSQTWLLEKVGWKGILIEPQPKNAEELRRNRPSSQVYEAAISIPGQERESIFYVNSVFSTLLPNTISSTKEYANQIKVSVLTLNEILENEKVPNIDFLKIDVEGTELDCLKGLDMARYRPKLVFVEDVFLSLDLHHYLLSNRYRLLRRTRWNNWYVPNEDPRHPSFAAKLKLFRKMYLGTPLRAWKFRREKARFKQNTLKTT
jgi:FkbM family methyltransferase